MKIESSSKSASRYPATAVRDVEIYRSEKPQYKWVEIGTAEVKSAPNDDRAVVRLRHEAARRGAHAVIDLQFNSKLYQTTVPVTTCSGTPAVCTTSYSTHSSTVQTITGTLIRRL